MKRPKKIRQVIGWREWVAIPELGITSVKAKIDTGAKTSALHAMHIKRFEQDGQAMVRFDVHPFQRDAKQTVTCEAPLIEERKVRSSNGQESKRPVVRVELELMGEKFPIELTLTNRDQMGFRMLLGRQAFRKRFLVDVAKSYCDQTHVPPDKKRKAKSKPS